MAGLLAPVVAPAEGPASAPVTEWPVRLGLTIVVLAVIALALWGMWRGWQNRGRRQAGIEAPAAPPAELGAPLLAPCDGVYLATTRAGDWLDRVVVHGLGTRSHATLTVGERGIRFDRDGAGDVFVPAADVRGVRVDRGIAGAVYEQGGVVVVTWRLGDETLDTGFRARRTDDHIDVATAVDALMRGDRPVPGASEGAST